MMNTYVRGALVLLYLLTWTTSVVAYHQLQPPLNFTEMKPTITSSGFSVLFPVTGNVYPIGRFTIRILISNGDRPKAYVLDIDTGSDLTWLACAGANPIPSNPYLPKTEDTIKCHDPECASFGEGVRNDCTSPSNVACQYTVSYVDGSSSSGTLVRGLFPLQLSNGKWIAPRLIFGCGIRNVIDRDPVHQPIPDGLLGLGKGKSGILKQLREMGVIRSVVGHCFSPQGGGSLFIGDFPVFGVTWKQLEKSDDHPHYHLGYANILLDGQATDIEGLQIVFDSGSTYTYLTNLAYQALLDLVTRNLNGSPLTVSPDDKTLPMCWRGSGPITSFDDQVFGYFKPLALNFLGAQNVIFEMLPKSYLIISKKGNVCFGILDAQEGGLDSLEEGVNLIGDISMHDKLVVYDNENEKVGWATANCTRRN